MIGEAVATMTSGQAGGRWSEDVARVVAAGAGAAGVAAEEGAEVGARSGVSIGYLLLVPAVASPTAWATMTTSMRLRLSLPAEVGGSSGPRDVVLGSIPGLVHLA
jgi:hypothetical protein